MYARFMYSVCAVCIVWGMVAAYSLCQPAHRDLGFDWAKGKAGDVDWAKGKGGDVDWAKGKGDDCRSSGL